MKPVTPATQVRKARKADPVGALLREKLRDERNGTGMVAVRGAEVTLAESKAGLRDEMEDEEDGSSSDSESEYVRRSTKGKGRMSSPAGPSRTQKAKRKDDDGSEDDEDIAGLDCEPSWVRRAGRLSVRSWRTISKRRWRKPSRSSRRNRLGCCFGPRFTHTIRTVMRTWTQRQLYPRSQPMLVTMLCG